MRQALMVLRKLYVHMAAEENLDDHELLRAIDGVIDLLEKRRVRHGTV